MKRPAVSFYFNMLHGGFLSMKVHDSGAEAIEEMRRQANSMFPNTIGGHKYKSIPKSGSLSIGFPFRRVGCRYLEPDEIKIMNDENLAWRKSDGHLVIHKEK